MVRLGRIICCVLAVAMVFTPLGNVYPLPEINKVVSGKVDVQIKDENTMLINASNKAVINYNSFDILHDESVLVTLPSADSKILNRVIQNNPSSLFGTLESNGIFILVNEAGIHVGPSANLAAAGLVLSTRDIADRDFLNGDFAFRRMSKEYLDMLLLNEGNIQVNERGFVALIAGAVENKGVIIAPMGKIALAGGDAVKLNLSGDGLISVAITEKTAGTVLDHKGKSITEQIKNSGRLEANGGVVLLSAESVTDIFESAINLEGFVKASRIEETGGVIRIVADNDVSLGTGIEATHMEISDPADGVPINVNFKEGSLDAVDKLTLSGADPVTLTGGVAFNDLEITTPGKEVNFEAGSTFIFNGRTYIKGEPGYDGLIKLFSSKEGMPWYARFLDPDKTDISYVAIRDAHNVGDVVKVRPSTNWGNSVNWDTDPVWDGGGSSFYWSEALNWDTDTIPTAFDVVTFNTTSHKDSIVDTNSGGGTFGGTVDTFTIDGYTGTITLERDLRVTNNYSQNSGAFNETEPFNGFSADQNVYNLSVGGTFSRTGGIFRGATGGTAEAVRIADVNELQAIETTGRLSENYVQYGNIDASATSGWNGGAGFDPIGDNSARFTGTFDGLGYTINGLYINRSESYLGFFGRTNGSTIQNVGLTNIDVTSGVNFIWIGGMVGELYNSTIRNSYVTGDLNLGYSTWGGGGLVASSYRGSDIIDSYSAVNVMADDDAYRVGGAGRT